MSTGKKRLLAYVIMAISVMISVRLVRDIIRLSHADERIIEAEKELLAAKEEQVELNQELLKAQTGDWWEAQVRDTLKMARENEEVVIVPEEVLKVVGQEQPVLVEKEESLYNFEKWQQVFGIIGN